MIPDWLVEPLRIVVTAIVALIGVVITYRAPLLKEARETRRERMEQDKAERVARLEAERAEYQEDRERREEYRAEIRSLRDELDDCAARRRKAEDEVDGLRRIIRVWEQHARRQGWELPEDPKDMRSA